jgi:3-phosphoshikimate 1-carboxyvinyltransferase
MGVDVEEFSDGMAIYGTGRLRGAEVDSLGDHRIAMTFAIAGLLAAEGTTTIHNAECVAISYPEFQRDLQSLIEVSGSKVAVD